MTTLHLTRGLPASGKTTFAKQWLIEGPTRARVNRDDIRFSAFGKYWGLTREEENLISVIQQHTVRRFLVSGYDVIVDDTNLNAKFAKEWLKLAAATGTEVEWHDEFLDVPLNELLSRDSAREKSVGKDVIVNFYNRYLSGGRRPKRPELAEESDAEALPFHEQYNGTPDMPDAVLVDLDGTIAQRSCPCRSYPPKGV